MKRNDIDIKKMEVLDLNLISDILKDEFDDFWNMNILKKELDDLKSYYIVCKLNDEIIGFAGITIILDIAELNNIVIKKGYRGQGFSKNILKYLIEIARKYNCKYMNLEVSSKNIVAINLYEQYGFKKVGIRKNYYKDSDAILYTKNLE